MESSHRRVINDLEEKHRKEIERLLLEKEQALAEETQVCGLLVFFFFFQFLIFLNRQL